ncbi:hypothetical protein [Pseudooceanicola algae]|uniref:Uncharacterized protein n=1 Tax=Pseudooceanicola algae TaxID=1537215 RepID=A0A418SJR0_9RHOB|nr:hypothetical protein [Pseudooceanicola algae]QPM90645.1 hypothetical protein PSAL_018840 [Pseudooceanicola algae]
MGLGNDYGIDINPSPFPRVALDQWMVDVLADLQEAAKDRGMTRVVDQLAIATRVTQEEILRKRTEASGSRRTVPEYYPSSPPAGYRKH